MTPLYITVGLILTLLGTGWAIYRFGKKREQGKAAEAQIQAVKEAKDAEDEVGRMSDAAVHDELHKWRR